MKLLVLMYLITSAAGAQEISDAKHATLRGLDKISGITQDMDINAGGEGGFGRLSIEMSDCRYPANDPSSDAFAHLTIRDKTIKRNF